MTDRVSFQSFNADHHDAVAGTAMGADDKLHD